VRGRTKSDVVAHVLIDIADGADAFMRERAHEHAPPRRDAALREARRLHFTGAMPDPETSRMSRDELLGLIRRASDKDHERITAEMPAARLDELLAPDEIAPDAVMRLDELFAAVLASAPLSELPPPPQSPLGSDPDLVPVPSDLLIRFKPTVDPRTSRHATITIFALTLALGLLLLLLLTP
jgi:hypothetical protein